MTPFKVFLNAQQPDLAKKSDAVTLHDSPVAISYCHLFPYSYIQPLKQKKARINQRCNQRYNQNLYIIFNQKP
jgi:hypothetical protein